MRRLNVCDGSIFCLPVHPIVIRGAWDELRHNKNTYRRGLTGSLSLETRKFEVLTREDKRKSIAPTSFLVGYFVRKRIEYEKELNVYYAIRTTRRTYFFL